jgi:hypothetical protein
VEKMKKYGGINKKKPKENVSTYPEEDLEFLLWKAELNKELTVFWKSISE